MPHPSKDEDSDTSSVAGADEKFSPKHMKNENGVFLLQHADMIALVRYLWAGCLLPLNRGEYASRLLVRQSDVNSHTWEYIDPVIDAYKQVHDHASTFRTNVYNQKLMGIANAIYEYCEKAGGGKGDSYYEGFMEIGDKYYNEVNSGNPNHKKLNQWASDIKEFTSDLKGDGDKLVRSCADLIADLSTFEEECTKDKTRLEPALSGLHSALVDNDGEIKNLAAQIKLDQGELANDQNSYDWDMQKVNEAPNYIWIFPIGTIVGGTMIGVYRDKAKKMAEAMKKLNEKISNEQKTFEADIRLAADVELMQHHGKTLLNLIQPAIGTLELLQTCWNDIKSDLEYVENMVNKPTSNGGSKDSPFKKMERKKVRKAWNILKKEVEGYRKHAYVSNVEIQSIEAAIKAYDS
ncbi:hypothetical protein EAE96_000117 [Botrytis aclada]|nr:hypothetical protein EAE96_000117 [Botrytis aclada]